ALSRTPDLHRRKLFSQYTAATAAICGQADGRFYRIAWLRLHALAVRNEIFALPGHASRQRRRPRSASDLLSSGESRDSTARAHGGSGTGGGSGQRNATRTPSDQGRDFLADALCGFASEASRQPSSNDHSTAQPARTAHQG